MATIMADETQYLTVCYTIPNSNHSLATITRHKRSVKHAAILKATLYKNVLGGRFVFFIFSSTKLKIPQLKCKKLIEQCVCVL